MEDANPLQTGHFYPLPSVIVTWACVNWQCYSVIGGVGFMACKDAVSTTEVPCPWEPLPLPPSGSLWAEILVSGGAPTVPLISGKRFRPWKEQLTIPSPSFLLLTYMDACVRVFINHLPATQLVADNYSSWLAFSWKHQTPCLARPPEAPVPTASDTLGPPSSTSFTSVFHPQH